ncbi:MAG TPA: hypothetical protein VGV61_13885 [Thermoanaerobaculia bacterium]|nr:hypothetical protein [Thermoanaerobaculia bacterium]
MLLVYGEADERVPARRSAAAIASALLAGAERSATVRLFADADHTFRLASPSPGFAWPRSADGYPQAVIDWVLHTVGAGHPADCSLVVTQPPRPAGATP